MSSSSKSKSPHTRKVILFNILLRSLHLEHMKENILAPYGVESSKALTDAQLDELIAGLQAQQEKSKEEPSRATRAKRSQILSLLTAIGIENRGQAGYWDRVNAYLSQPRVAGKLLYEMTDEELIKCIAKLNKIKEVVEKRQNDEKHWAQFN